MAQQDEVQSMSDYASFLRRRWPILAAIIPSALLLAVLLAFTLPASYQSSATILLEPSSIPTELVRTTVVSYADQQIELVQRTVMTVDKLEPIIAEVDPYPDEAELSMRDKALLVIDNTSLQKVDPVTLEPLAVSAAFSIFYENPDPQLAAAVTERIARLFLEYNRETRTALAREATSFLQVKATEVEGRIRGLEQQVADFKRRYGDALPESRVRNEASLDRTQRDLDSAEAEVRVVEQQESLLRLQLSQISPTIVASGTDAYTQLGQLRAELAAAQQKYTPDHPDVRRLTRAIEALAVQANPANRPTVRPDNPDYIRIASELSSVQRNLTALRATAARARSQQSDYERRLSDTPTVERDYVQIERQRAQAQTEYEEIQAKLREAEVAQSLESEARGERYTLIRPARVPTKPFSPNRLGIILIGLVLGGGLAVGIAAFRESTDPTVRGSHDILKLSGLPLIGSIPTLTNQHELSRRRLVLGSAAGVYLLAVVIVVMTVVGS